MRSFKLSAVLLCALFLLQTIASAQDVITTIAGEGIAGSSFNLPTGVAVDSFGNLYVADAQNCVVWEITNGVRNALAGIQGNCTPGAGSGAQQSLAYPIDVAVCGDNLYFATHGFDPILNNQSIDNVIAGGVFEISNGTFSTLPLPSAPAGSVTPLFPVAIACDSAGDVYVASYFYEAQTALSGSVDEIPAGSTTTQNLISLLNTAYPGVTVDSNNNVFALGVSGVAAGWLGTTSFTSNGFVYQLNGNGSATAALTSDIPSGLPNTSRLASNGVGNFLITTAKSDGNPTVYVTSVPGASAGYQYDAGNGTAGYKDNVQATLGELDNPTGLTVDACGSIYVADSGNNVVRKIFNQNTAGTAACTTGTGSGTGPGPGGNPPALYASLSMVNSNGQITAGGSIPFYASVGISNCTSNCTTPLQGEVFFCSFSSAGFVPANSTDSEPCQGGALMGSVAVSPTSGTTGSASYQASLLFPGTYYVAAEYFDLPYVPYTTASQTVTVCGASCSDSGVPNIPFAKKPVALTPGALGQSPYTGSGMVALDAKGNEYFLNGSAGTVILMDVNGGTSTIVSSSTAVSTGGTLGTMNNLGDIVVGTDSNLYITDTGNNRVIQVESPTSGSPTVNVINIGSTGGTLSPPLTAPIGIFETNDEVYVTDFPSSGPRLVAFEPNGGYPTVELSSATTGAPALGQLLGVVVNPTTATAYLANSPAPGNTSGGNILKMPLAGTPSVIATPGITLQSPYGIAMDAAGGLYFSDTGTHQVYRVDIHGNVIVVAGNGTATESLENLILGESAVSATQTGLANPTWLALDPSNSIYILDGSELLYLDVTQSIVDFTAASQSQTIYVTNPVASTQGSVETEFGTPLLSGTAASDFTVDTTGTCSRTSSNLLSSNTSCTLVVTLSSAGSNTSATACTLAEIEVSLGPPLTSGSCSAPPAGLTNQTITLNSITAPATTLQITGTAVQGTYNVPYSPVQFFVTGGSGQYTFSESGALPLQFSNGVLSGTPQQGGSFPFTVNVSDAVGDTGSLTQTLVINPAETTTSLTVCPASVTGCPSSVDITQPMTLTATVLYSGAPVTTGAVAFVNYSTDTQIGLVPLNSSGQASLTVDSPGTPGFYVFQAEFVGTPNLATSSNAVTVIVTSAPPTVPISIVETILVSDTPTFPDVFDTEPITVTDTPLIVTEPAQLSISAPVAYYSVGSLGFGNQTGTQSFSLSNIGEAPLSLTGTPTFNSGASFSLSQTQCTNGASSLPTTLPPSGACEFYISYTAPDSGVPATDAINFADNSALSNVTSTGSWPSYTQSIPLNGSGASTPPGPPPQTTVYASDSETITVTDTVNVTTITPTTTTVSGFPNPAYYGQTVILTAIVSSGTGAPGGSVSFFDGSVPLGTATLTGGSATLDATRLTIGNHSITASYSGNASFEASTSAILTQIVALAPTTVAIVSSADPVAVKTTVTYAARVTSPYGNTLTGTVTMTDGATVLGTFVVGQAVYSTSYPKTGEHTLAATYSGDGYNSGSSGALNEYVVTALPAPTTTTVTTSGTPSVLNQPVTFTSTTTSPDGSIPNGETVTFYDGATEIGTGTTLATLKGAVATFTTSALTVRTHTISATYAGDSSFRASSGAVQQVVNRDPTVTSWVASPHPSIYGEAVTLLATVSNVSGSITPTGMVTFLNGATKLGTVTLNGGTASFVTASLPVGSDVLTASYGGDGNDAPSTSSTFTQTVNQATTMTQVTSSLNPSLSGQKVTFTITVTSLTTTPTGTVTLIDCYQNPACPTTLQLGTATLNRTGTATISVSNLTVNYHYVEAQYQGTSDFSGSTSPQIVQTVNAHVTYLNPLNFGTVAPGKTKSLNLIVTNRGLASLTVSGTPTFSGPGAAQFAVLPSSSCLSGAAISPQGSCEMIVQFTSPTGPVTTYNPSLQFAVIDEDGVSNPETDTVTATN